MPVTIRPATERDISALVGLCEGLFREDSAVHDPLVDQGWPRREGAAYFHTFLVEPRQRAWVAERESGTPVIGYLTARLAEGASNRPVRVAVLESFYVTPDQRNDGIGTRLVNAFTRWAIDQGADHLRVSVSAGNDDAHRLYERLGFRPLHVSFERPVSLFTA